MDKLPYLHVVDMPRKMGGEGAPRQTVFGVLGHTKDAGLMKSLGGLIIDSSHAKAPKATEKASAAPKNSEHHIIGPASKTHISGMHYGQVPYAGQYMAPAGKMLS